MMNELDLTTTVLRGLLQDAPAAPWLVAYIGPGAGLSAIGALLAVLAGCVLAVFGFVWYPVKRLLRSRRRTGPDPRIQATE